MAILSGGQSILNFSHIEGITLGVSEEVEDLARGASGMGVNRNYPIHNVENIGLAA